MHPGSSWPGPYTQAASSWLQSSLSRPGSPVLSWYLPEVAGERPLWGRDTLASGLEVPPNGQGQRHFAASPLHSDLSTWAPSDEWMKHGPILRTLGVHVKSESTDRRVHERA